MILLSNIFYSVSNGLKNGSVFRYILSHSACKYPKDNHENCNCYNHCPNNLHFLGCWLVSDCLNNRHIKVKSDECRIFRPVLHSAFYVYRSGSSTTTFVPSSTKSFFFMVSFSIDSDLPPISFMNFSSGSTSRIKSFIW